jgi:putative transposase
VVAARRTEASAAPCLLEAKSASGTKINIEIKVKGGGQECPPYTFSTCSFVTDRSRADALEWAMPNSLIRKYEYRRRMPHYQKPGRTLFVTFCKLIRDPFPPAARDLVLGHCIHDDGKRIDLKAAVVMPDHVHLLFMPLADEHGWPHPLPLILKLIKGMSARSVNKLMGVSGPVWQEESFDHVLRSEESLQEKLEYIRQNPVRKGLVARPEDYPWLWVAPT